MLDFDLAQLYEVETKALNQAVKRNIKSSLRILCFVLLFLNGWVSGHNLLNQIYDAIENETQPFV